MYAQYFGLNEKPFSIAPDPRYLFQSERHAEALAHLLYGVEEAGGFIQLTGEVGTGKTTLTRVLLNRLPLNVDVAMILNPRLSVREFLQNICEELQLDWPDDGHSLKGLIDTLNKHLLKAHADGRRVVLIIDEAQNLDADLLEQLRLLTNLETSERKLLQIILIGQPELRQTLARSDLRQLAQRITGRYHLDPLTRDETQNYIHHRLQIAGASREIFTRGAVREVHRLSEGVPRLINIICDRALLGAYSREKAVVDTRLARQAAGEVQGRVIVSPGLRWAKIAALVGAVAILAGAARYYWPQNILAVDAQASRTQSAQPPAQSMAQSAVQAEVRAGDTVEDQATPPSNEPSNLSDNLSDNLSNSLSANSSALIETTAEQGIVETAGARDAASESLPGPALFDLPTLLSTSSELTDNDTAFSGLFRLWDKAYVRGPTRACDQASAQGLKCLFQRGSWNHLVTLNIPAILSLTDAAGEDHQVVLARVLDDQQVVLRIGSSDYPVSTGQLNSMWFGDSLLLWRPHQGADRLLSPGARGAGVEWLRAGLGKFADTGSPIPADPALYDESLSELVRKFQRDHGLRVDGIAGERTLVKLQALLREAGVPLLTQDS